mgnify:CR=1 FL=1
MSWGWESWGWGDSSGGMVAPSGFAFWVDDDGAYFVDDDGAFILLEV